MKMKIHIQGKIIVAALLVVVGLLFVVMGVFEQSDYKDAKMLDNLTKDDVKDDTYIRGKIDSYVAKKVGTKDDIKWSGVSATYVDFVDGKDVYTIKLPDGNYIQYMVISQEKKDEFENLYNGDGADIYVEGRIVKTDIEVDKEWFQDVDKNQYPNLENIIEGYIIEEISSDDVYQPFYAGGTMIVIAILLFIYAGGIDGSVEKRIVDNYEGDAVEIPFASYNKENELLNYEYQLECLAAERIRINEMSKIMIGAIIVGILFGLTSPVLNIIGFIVSIVAVSIWVRLFMNSSNLTAIKLSKRFKARSVYLEMKRLERKIQECRESIELDEM